MSFKKVYKNYVNETDPQKKMSHLDAISQFFDNYQNSWLHIISGIVFFLSNSIFLLVVYHFLGGTIVTDGKIAKYLTFLFQFVEKLVNRFPQFYICIPVAFMVAIVPPILVTTIVFFIKQYVFSYKEKVYNSHSTGEVYRLLTQEATKISKQSGAVGGVCAFLFPFIVCIVFIFAIIDGVSTHTLKSFFDFLCAGIGAVILGFISFWYGAFFELLISGICFSLLKFKKIVKIIRKDISIFDDQWVLNDEKERIRRKKLEIESRNREKAILKRAAQSMVNSGEYRLDSGSTSSGSDNSWSGNDDLDVLSGVYGPLSPADEYTTKDNSQYSDFYIDVSDM